jgi:hypothetical protein
MGKKSTPTIIIFLALILFITLDKLGLTLISQIGMGAVTIVILILNLPNIKAMNKKLLAISLSITIIPGLILVFAMFFVTENNYLLDGSLICFLLSFPISLVVVGIYRKK